MGVPVIWDVIKPGMEERLPFVILVTQFYKQYGRPIRIAIDAYQWIFECRGIGLLEPVPQNVQIGRLLANFQFRIRYLLSLNISFVFVFDGDFKPLFKNKDIQFQVSSHLEDEDFDEDRKRVLKLLNQYSLTTQDPPDVGELKEQLRRWNIDFVEAPSEGESEAADLQRLGVVDYVLSNDTDTMMYGATRILRNFSKFQEDKPAGAVAARATSEYWVTPVIMENVTKETGFDKKRLILLSILCGADYNLGVNRLGAQRASQIALSSTAKIKSHGATVRYDEFPDFASELHDIYSNDDLRTSERITRYIRLQGHIFKQISNNLREYFGKNEKALVKDGKLEGYPPDFIVKLYHKPLLCTEKFVFKVNSTNFAEVEDGEKWMSLPKFDQLFSALQKYPPPNVLNIGKWFSLGLSEAYLLKCVLYDIKRPISLEKTKIKKIADSDWEIEMISVRYQSYFHYGDIQSESEEEQGQSPRKRKSTKGKLEWVPLDLVPLESNYYQQFFIKEEEKRIAEEQQKKKSPRKVKPKQGTNLLSMGFIDVPNLPPVNQSPSKPRRKASVSKDTSPKKGGILEMLKSPSRMSPLKASTMSSVDSSPQSINVSPLDAMNGFSPLKSKHNSPERLKIGREIDESNKQSPIRVKSRKQNVDSSPSKGIRTYNRSQLPTTEGDVSLTRKRLVFDKDAEEQESVDPENPFQTSPFKTGHSVLDDLLKDSDSQDESDDQSSPIKPAGKQQSFSSHRSGDHIACESPSEKYHKEGLEDALPDGKIPPNSSLPPEKKSKDAEKPTPITKSHQSDDINVIWIDSESETESSLDTPNLKQQIGKPHSHSSHTRKSSLRPSHSNQLDTLKLRSIEFEDSSPASLNKEKKVETSTLQIKDVPPWKYSYANEDSSEDVKAINTRVDPANKPTGGDAKVILSRKLMHRSHYKEVEFSDDDGVYDDGDYVFETDFESSFDSKLSVDADYLLTSQELEKSIEEAHGNNPTNKSLIVCPKPEKRPTFNNTRPALSKSESNLKDFDAVMDALEFSDDSILSDDTI